jgi:FkbM family methyltransferase
MHLKSLVGKTLQLRQARASFWQPFITGWLKRRQTGVVPCVIPRTDRLLYVPLPDFYEAYLFFCETVQGRKELEGFLEKLRPGDVLYDIGGFRGVYTAASKLRFGDALKIRVFEPLPQNSEAIRRVCTLNHFNQVEIVPLAVGESDSIAGKINLRDGMLRIGDPLASEVATFKSVSLDQYIANGAPVPSLIKIDVEGYEWAVLKGAQRCLEKVRPRLWLEVHPQFLRQQGKTPEELLDWLRDLGYSVNFFWDHELPAREIAFHVWCS